MSIDFDNDPLTESIIGAAIEVHKHLGPGLLESAYEAALAIELQNHSLSFERQKNIPVLYKNTPLNLDYRLDFLIENKVILELKSVESFLPVHQAQLLSYMKLTGISTGLLINFNVPLLKDGIIRRKL